MPPKHLGYHPTIQTRLKLTAVFVASVLAMITPSLSAEEHPELKVPANARNVQHGAQQGAAGVAYEVTIPYPAKEFLGKLQTDLSALGWRPLEMDWVNPTIPSSIKRGWQSYIDARKPDLKYVHAWSADWKDSQGNVLSYGFHYESAAPKHVDDFAPIPDPANSELHAHASFMPASLATRMHEWVLAHPSVTKTEDVAPEKRRTPKHPSGDLSHALQLGITDLKRTSRRMSDGTLMDGVSYKLHLENKSNADIASLKYEIVFKDRNGKPLSTMTMDDNGSIAAGVESVQEGWAPFDCDASGVKGVDLRVEQGPITVRFADGTTASVKTRTIR